MLRQVLKANDGKAPEWDESYVLNTCTIRYHTHTLICVFNVHKQSYRYGGRFIYTRCALSFRYDWDSNRNWGTVSTSCLLAVNAVYDFKEKQNLRLCKCKYNYVCVCVSLYVFTGCYVAKVLLFVASLVRRAAINRPRPW